jgi:4a-hydroxytetrahydrobiopterin dehydratase
VLKKLDEKEITDGLNDLEGWRREGDTIVKEYKSSNFRRAMDFADKVAKVAEELNHHPIITIDFNRVVITLTTHTHGGLTDRDFQEASLIDGLLIDYDLFA